MQHQRTRFPTTSEIMERLFDLHRKADGSERTEREIAQKMAVHHSHVMKIRSGDIRNPTISTTADVCFAFDEENPLIFFPASWDRYAPHYWKLFPEHDEFPNG